MAEGDRKTAEMKCLVQNSPEVEWPFDTYLEPPVTMGQMNLDSELPNGRTQFLNSNGFGYTDYSVEISKIPNVMVQELAHERQGQLLNPGNGITTGLVHNGYAYDPCGSGVGSFEQGNDLIRGYVPPFVRAYDQGYQEMGGHEFAVPPLQPPHLHHPAEPSLEIGCTAVKEDSHFLHSLSLNGDIARSASEEYPRCYSDLSNMPQPPFIKSPASSVSLMDISQSHLVSPIPMLTST